MIYEGHSHQKFGHLTYSQHGEDLMFMNLWKLMGLEKLTKPSYLDIGAYHPINISNTALLYENGCRGVNVDANWRLINEFQKIRPEDHNIYYAVGLKTGIFPFYLESEESVLNSLKHDSFAQHNTKFNKIIEVPVITLNELVAKFCDGKFPDFLMTDIEGMDFEVLASTDFSKSKPKVICTEIDHKSGEQLKGSLRPHFTFLCRIQSNMIFVANDYYWKVV